MTETVENTFYEAPQLAPKRPRNKDGTDGHALYFVNERGRARNVSVWDRSLLAQLRGLSEWLAQRYRWELAQSTMFVLTGEIPAVPPLKVTASLKFSEELFDATTTIPEYIDATINVTASPWVSSRTVTRAYRIAQTEVMGTSGGKPPGLKNLRLFRFVTARIEPSSARATRERLTSAPGRTRMPDGKRLVREWNEAHPRWAYKTSVGDPNTRLFWRDYNRIRRTIAVGPPYHTRNHEATVQQLD
jgi:hypothetical protein